MKFPESAIDCIASMVDVDVRLVERVLDALAFRDAIRNAALEEAAKACDWNIGQSLMADKIRALKTEPPR